MNGFLTLLVALISFLLTTILGKWLIPYLHKVKYGQTILDIGPSWHKDKQGTPTMGGIMFIIGIVISLAVCIPIYYFTASPSEINVLAETPVMLTKLVSGIFMALGYGAIGFFDDYIKVVKKRNLGLTERQKLVLQFSVAIVYLIVVFLVQKYYGSTTTFCTIIPFVGDIDFSYFYIPISAIIIVGAVNAVNLTDGIDGLNSSVTFFVAIFFMIISSFLGMFGMTMLSVATAGGCIGFLVWNFNPAKIFMGDTGSLFLGGIVCAIAFGINMPILMVPLGIIYICEITSVVLQVLYFKLTHGKRLFKMSPLHHHFEMSGWTETKICAVFSLVTIIGGIVALLSVIFGI